MQTEIEDALALALGRVVIEAARVEYVGAQLEAAMIGTPNALPVVGGQAWSTISAGIQSLVTNQLNYGLLTESDGELIRSTVKDATTHMDERSSVVHAVWEPAYLPANGPRAMRQKRWGKYSDGYWTVGKMKMLVEDLRSARIMLDALFAEAAARSGE